MPEGAVAFQTYDEPGLRVMPLADMLAEAGVELETVECPDNIKDLQKALSHKY